MSRKRSTSERGYGSSHQALRKAWQAKVSAGGVVCQRCGFEILPEGQWDLGHDDNDRTAPQTPEHARCNRRAGGKKGAAASRRGRPSDLERWRQIARDPKWRDDPARGVYWGPPGLGGVPLRWSQAWYPWRDEVR